MIDIQNFNTTSAYNKDDYISNVVNEMVCDAHDICNKRSEEVNRFTKIEISSEVYTFTVNMLKKNGLNEQYFKETLYVPFDFKQTYENELNTMYNKYNNT